MTTYQKIFILITCLFAGILVINSCSKDDDNDKKCTLSGIVIARSLDKCGCCPGWLIKYGNDTLKFQTVPNEDLLCDLVNFYGFPIPIKFNYEDDNSSCSDFYKIMTCVEFDLGLNCSKEGEIIDYNGTECMCCPGWIIKVGQDTIKVLNLPIESQIRKIFETNGFPISIKLDYENITGSCEDFYKKITCMTIKN